MKKITLILFGFSILANCFSQQIAISSHQIKTSDVKKAEIYNDSNVLESIKEFHHQRNNAKKSATSRWYNYGLTMFEHKQAVSFINILFPDTTIIYKSSFGYAPPWIHSIGTVIDPTSIWFNETSSSDDLILSKSDGYSVDSIGMYIKYQRHIHDITDTLIFEFRVFENNNNEVAAPLLQFTDPNRFNNLNVWNTDTAFIRIYQHNTKTTEHEVKEKILTYKYLLTSSDTIPNPIKGNFQYLKYKLPSPICVEPNHSVLCNVKFKPGYTWISNTDTLNKKNHLRFYSVEENGNNTLIDYNHNDYNASFSYATISKYDKSYGYYGYALSAQLFEAFWAFEHHLIDFNISSRPKISAVVRLDTSVCSGDMITLSATEGDSYRWNTGDTSKSITVYPIGTNTYTVTVYKGCVSAIDDYILTVNISSVDLGSDVVSCGSSHTIDAGPFYSFYLWSTGSNNQTITVSNTDTYRLTATDRNGCKAVDSIHISFYPAPNINLYTKNSDCNNSNGSAWVDVSGGTGGYTYIWSAGSSSLTDSIFNLDGGIVYVTVSDSNCNIPYKATINENGGPSLSVSPSSSNICENESVEITTKGADLYFWSPTSYIKAGSDSSYELTPLVSTTYSLKGETNGCATFEEIIIKVKELPRPNLGQDINISMNDIPYDVFLTPGSNFILYKWQDNSLSSTFSTTVSDSYSAKEGINYYCEVTSLNGCKATDTVFLIIIPDGINELPNNSSIKIYPNPNIGKFSIETNELNEKLDITIYSITGKLVDRFDINPRNNNDIGHYEIPEFEKGIYIIRIVGKDVLVTRKLIVR